MIRSVLPLLVGNNHNRGHIHFLLTVYISPPKTIQFAFLCQKEILESTVKPSSRQEADNQAQQARKPSNSKSSATKQPTCKLNQERASLILVIVGTSGHRTRRHQQKVLAVFSSEARVLRAPAACALLLVFAGVRVCTIALRVRYLALANMHMLACTR